MIKEVFCNLFFLLCIKMSEWNSIEGNSIKKNRDVILNRAKDYYEHDKERLKSKQEKNSEEKTFFLFFV